MTKAIFCNYEFDFPSADLVELQDCNDVLDNTEALRKVYDERGYLLIRGMHDRSDVHAARDIIIRNLLASGQIKEGTEPSEMIAAEGASGAFAGGRKELTHSLEFLNLVESPRLMSFFDTFFGEKTRTYDYKWLRMVPPGGHTGFHYDVVYMGRGTLDLMTCWTPFQDVSMDRGPLILCLGSQEFKQVRQTYGTMDVDEDKVRGWFSNDPKEVVDKFGGQWATTEFEAGDVLIFGMYMLHGAITNTTGRFRVSADTRYQAAAAEIDNRWIGEKPKAHTSWHEGPGVEMEDARREWGIS